MKSVLSIAGSDCSGGAGIQADLKTMMANGVYGMSAITAVTAQNTMGVQGIFPITPEFLEKQLISVFSDIVPDAVKIGMVSGPELIDVIAQVLTKYKAKNIVIDPVMVASSKDTLVGKMTIERACEILYPLATVLTPNIAEAEVLWGKSICNRQHMENAATELGERLGCSVLVKGGHRRQDADDLLYNKQNGDLNWVYGRRIDNPNTHGTGCTLSSSIAANLAKGYRLYDSVVQAKEYMTTVILSGLDLGRGSGPLNHAATLTEIVEK
ncbi:MAG: bifunctional hydroxymethylpyrimidine kinase/phosphomethylpyrimidine kinase [Lachnospiraceae bacterium]|nr:bifunctional hydroxymethylpyrimidine kinase/phosphomethylpyrimidine kinase [Lachnospiraceae bacterium]